MTDNEIRKALRCCADRYCKGCLEQGKAYCKESVAALAWDLIVRQKEEIERLQKECEITRAYIHNNGLEWGLVSHLEFCKNQRAEAIKEFATKLKSKAVQKYDWNEYVEIEDIDNLVKEMEEET